MAVRKTTSRRRIGAPKFRALWTKAEGLAAVNRALALNNPSAVAERLASIILAGDAATMNSTRLDEETITEMARLLNDAESALELQRRIVIEARRRVAITARYKLCREAARASVR
jgi:hypothetical protein